MALTIEGGAGPVSRTARRGVRRSRWWAAASVAILGLSVSLPAAGASPAGTSVVRPDGGFNRSTLDSTAFDPHGVAISLVRIPGTFSQPLLLTHAGDGSGRRFVVEQGGRIKIIKNGAVLSAPFLDLSPSVSTGSEQGLLGLAFHPSFATNGRFYVNLTLSNGDTAINEYRVTTDPDRVDWHTGRRIMTVAQPYDNHNGGGLAFGPDGYLYIGLGDGGSAGDPGNRAQSLTSLLGKMLRIDVNGTTPSRGWQYRVPPTNPYVGIGGWDEIWSRGLRNPWRWSFDRSTGDLWIGDVGQNRYEEIDRSTRAYHAGGRGANYGWRILEGRHCYNPSSGCVVGSKILPLVEYGHAVSGDDNCSVTGGYVYRGAASPVLQGGYLFGDYCSGRIWAISATASDSVPASPVQLLDTSLFISSFGQDQAGEVYVVDHAGGGIYRIVASPI